MTDAHDDAYSDTADTALQVPPGDLKVSPFNPPGRDRVVDQAIQELAQDMAGQGVLQPLRARPTAAGTLELVFGHRRRLAALEAGLATVPVMEYYRPHITKAEREHTPPELAQWLVELARRCSVRLNAISASPPRRF